MDLDDANNSLPLQVKVCKDIENLTSDSIIDITSSVYRSFGGCPSLSNRTFFSMEWKPGKSGMNFCSPRFLRLYLLLSDNKLNSL